MRIIQNGFLCTIAIWMCLGCNMDMTKSIKHRPKINDTLCTEIIKKPEGRNKNYFKNTKVLKQMDVGERAGNILFLNCVRMKYQEMIREDIEPNILKFSEGIDYPENTTSEACDSDFTTSIRQANNKNRALVYPLMRAICTKYKVHQGIKEIDKMIVRGGDLIQQGCNVHDLYQSDQPGQNLRCISLSNNLAEKGLPASGMLSAWDPKRKNAIKAAPK